MEKFLKDHSLYNLINTPTCFKSKAGTCIDLILTNKRHSFKLTNTIETGLSDFHKMIATTCKQTFYKLPPKTIIYRDYKRFNEESFIQEFNELLFNKSISIDFSNFYKQISTILDKHAPQKQKVLRGNDKPFIDKRVRKEIFKISFLKNKASKTDMDIDRENFRKHRNYVTSLIKKNKKQYFKTIELEKKVNSFWKTVTLYLTSKINDSGDRIAIKDDNKNLITDEKYVGEIINDYFANITKSHTKPTKMETRENIH